MKTILSATLLAAVATLMLTACAYSGASESKRPPQSEVVIAANETAAMARLRVIVSAERRYMLESGGEYASLETLQGKGIMGDPDKGKLNNYRFSVRVKPG